MQMKRLMVMVRSLRGGSRQPQEVIIGNLASGWAPGRVEGHKYYISPEVYPDAMYPPFVTGPSYLISRAAVSKIFDEAMESPFIHLEDVFLTGVIAEKLGIPRRYKQTFVAVVYDT